jgi:hypothetical protein
MPGPRIVLVHAVQVAMEPVESAFRSGWPEAERVNLLDDSLSPDRAATDRLPPAMFDRFAALTDYAAAIGAAGVLFTCSAFGPAIERAAAGRAFPVFKPNEAMFDEALRRGTRLGMLATFAPSVAGMEEEFRAQAVARGVSATIETICVPEAMTALRAGDPERHNTLLASAAPRLARCDAVMLAHFSTSRAAAAAQAVLACPVLTAPGSAVARLRAELSG